MTPFPPQAWDAYQRHRGEIGALLDPRCYTIEWLDQQLASQCAMAFGDDKAVIVVSWKVYPTGTTELHGLVAAGALESVLWLIEEAESWGRGHGFTFSCIASRPGWQRVLKDRGYAVHQTELRKDLR